MPCPVCWIIICNNRVEYLQTCATDLLATANTPDADWWPQVAAAMKDFEHATKHAVRSEGYSGPPLDPTGVSIFIKSRVISGRISDANRDTVIQASVAFENVMAPLMVEAQDYT
jgi:hypothetical protein